MCKVCLFGEKMMLMKLKKVISNNLLLKNYPKQLKIEEKTHRKLSHNKLL